MNKKIVIYIFVFLILGAAAVYIYQEMNVIKVSASKISADYLANSRSADESYLNKTVEVTGKVKAFYKLLNTRQVLEFQVADNMPNIFCFFLSEPDEYKASQLQEYQSVTIRGRCVGMDKYNFVEGVKIEVEKFVE